MKHLARYHTLLRPWLFAFASLSTSVFVYLPMALLVFPTASYAGYCDNDNDAPDPDDATNAQCQPPDPDKNRGGGCTPDSNGGQCKTGRSSGNPINNSTGNKFQEEVDYVSQGVFPLRIIRYYNSQSTIANGSFGANWSHAYGSKIIKLSNVKVKAVRADEKTFTFNLNNNFIMSSN